MSQLADREKKHLQIGHSAAVMDPLDTPSVHAPVPVRFGPNGIGLIGSHYDEGFFMAWRTDPFPKILLIIEGAGTLHLETDRMAFRAFSVCIIPKGLLHRMEDERGRPVSLYGICLKRAHFADRDLMAAVFHAPAVHAHVPAHLPALFKELMAEERLQAPHADPVQIAIVLRVLVEFARRRTAHSSLHPDARQRVRLCAREMEHGFWREQDIDTAARKAGLSRRRFTQLFRDLEGESWHSRLTRLRLAHAARLLHTTRLSIRAVGFESGYADLSHFYRMFRAEHGTSPADFRQARDRPRRVSA
jgi:AraC-like DNA-binding protein